MVNPMFLRRFFLPSASTFIVYAKSNDDNKTKKDEKKDDKKDKDGKNKKKDPKKEVSKPDCEKLVKAVDLPIYSDYKGNRKESQAINENSVVITTIRCMRQELCFFMEQVQVVKQELSEVYLTGKAHTQQTIEYLRDPDNVFPRAGAISAGALTGYLIALRKGKFKKLVFMSAGAGAVSAILYPQEAQYYCEEALKVMKKYVIIAYHFFNGDFAAGKPLVYEETPKRSKKYIPSKLQKEFLDIQDDMADSAISCKDENEEDEKDKKKNKKGKK